MLASDRLCPALHTDCAPGTSLSLVHVSYVTHPHKCPNDIEAAIAPILQMSKLAQRGEAIYPRPHT